VRFNEGASLTMHLDAEDIAFFEKLFAAVRKDYLPWISREFELIAHDATWRCKTCLSEIEGQSELGGVVFQMYEHIKERHVEKLEFILPVKDWRVE
jgi:hypothetical protein